MRAQRATRKPWFGTLIELKRDRSYRGDYQFAGLVEIARTLRKEQTSAEALLWALLRDRRLLGFKFRPQHQFGDYVADFYCREASLAIECDGSVHETNEQWHHDQARDAYFASQGIFVLRFSNSQILDDTEAVLSAIAMRLPSSSGRGAGVRACGTQLTPSSQPSPRGRGR